jgi:hypothetical protein
MKKQFQPPKPEGAKTETLTSSVSPLVSDTVRQVAFRLIELSDLGYSRDERRTQSDVAKEIDRHRVQPHFDCGIDFEPVDALSGMFVGAGLELKDLWNQFWVEPFEKSPNEKDAYALWQAISPALLAGLLPTFVMPISRRVLVWTPHIDAAFSHHLETVRNGSEDPLCWMRESEPVPERKVRTSKGNQMQARFASGETVYYETIFTPVSLHLK